MKINLVTEETLCSWGRLNWSTSSAWTGLGDESRRSSVAGCVWSSSILVLRWDNKDDVINNDWLWLLSDWLSLLSVVLDRSWDSWDTSSLWELALWAVGGGSVLVLSRGLASGVVVLNGGWGCGSGNGDGGECNGLSDGDWGWAVLGSLGSLGSLSWGLVVGWDLVVRAGWGLWARLAVWAGWVGALWGSVGVGGGWVGWDGDGAGGGGGGGEGGGLLWDDWSDDRDGIWAVVVGDVLGLSTS